MKKSVTLFAILIFTLFVSSILPNQFVNGKEACNVASIRASHILVDSKSEAESIKSELNLGVSFEKLAKKYSKCPSGQDGGDLGYFKKGIMVKEFENAAFALPVGKISEPVQTNFGWHIIKVTDKK